MAPATAVAGHDAAPDGGLEALIGDNDKVNGPEIEQKEAGKLHRQPEKGKRISEPVHHSGGCPRKGMLHLHGQILDRKGIHIEFPLFWACIG